MNFNVTGLKLNPLDSTSRTPKVVPKVQVALEELSKPNSGQREVFLKEIQSNNLVVFKKPEAVIEDIVTAQQAIAALNPDGLQALKGLLLNVVREATLAHRLEHSPPEKPAIQESVEALEKSPKKGAALKVNGLDRVQQAYVLQTVLSDVPKGKFSVTWGEVGVRQVTPRHLSKVFISGGSDPTYTGLYKELKHICHHLNKQVPQKETGKTVPIRDLLKIIAAPSEDAISDRFETLLKQHKLDPANFSAEKQRLKSIGFLMYTLEPARDPVALATNLLAEKLVQKGLVTARHFVYPTGKLGTLTPALISKDQNIPELTHKKGSVPGLSRNIESDHHAVFENLDALNTDKDLNSARQIKVDKKVATVPDLKAERTFAVIRAVLEAAADEPELALASRFGSYKEFDTGFRNLSLAVQDLSLSLLNKKDIDLACAQLKKVLVRDMLDIHYQQTHADKALGLLAECKPGDDLSEPMKEVMPLIEAAFKEEQTSQVVKISARLAELKDHKLVNELSVRLWNSGSPIEAAQLQLQIDQPEVAAKMAETLKSENKLFAAGKVCLMLKDFEQVEALGIQLVKDDKAGPAKQLGEHLVELGEPKRAIAIAGAILKLDTPEAALQAAELYTLAEAYDQARELGVKLAKDYPDKAEAVALGLMDAGKYGKAETIAMSLIGHGHSGEAVNLAEMLADNDKTDKAASLAEALGNKGFKQDAAHLYTYMGEYAKAAAIAIEYAGSDPDKAFDIATELRDNRPTAKADRDAHKLVNQQLSKIAEALEKQGRLDLAAFVYLKAGAYEDAMTLAKTQIGHQNGLVLEIANKVLNEMSFTKGNEIRVLELASGLLKQGDGVRANAILQQFEAKLIGDDKKSAHNLLVFYLKHQGLKPDYLEEAAKLFSRKVTGIGRNGAISALTSALGGGLVKALEGKIEALQKAKLRKADLIDYEDPLAKKLKVSGSGEGSGEKE